MIPGRVIDMSPKPFSYIKEGKVIKLSVVSNPENYIVENYINKSFRTSIYYLTENQYL